MDFSTTSFLHYRKENNDHRGRSEVRINRSMYRVDSPTEGKERRGRTRHRTFNRIHIEKDSVDRTGGRVNIGRGREHTDVEVGQNNIDRDTREDSLTQKKSVSEEIPRYIY